MTQHIYGAMILAFNLWISRRVYKLDIKVHVLEKTIEIIAKKVCPEKEE